MSAAVVASEQLVSFMGMQIPLWFLSFTTLLSLGLVSFFGKEFFKFYHARKVRRNGTNIDIQWVVEQMMASDQKHILVMERIAKSIENQDREIKQLVAILGVVIKR